MDKVSDGGLKNSWSIRFSLTLIRIYKVNGTYIGKCIGWGGAPRDTSVGGDAL